MTELFADRADLGSVFDWRSCQPQPPVPPAGLGWLADGGPGRRAVGSAPPAVLARTHRATGRALAGPQHLISGSLPGVCASDRATVDDVAEAAMLGRLRAGDEREFRVLVERHSCAMRRLALSFVGSASTADEVVQETWLAVIKGLDGFAGRSSLKSWMNAGSDDAYCPSGPIATGGG